MQYHQIRLLTCFAFLFLLFQSCTKDEDFAIADAGTEQLRSDNQDGRDGRGPNRLVNTESEIALAWMDLFLELERYAAGMRPNASARAIAYIHLAAYETGLPAMPDFESNEERLPGLEIQRLNNSQRIDWEIALNASYAASTRHFLLNIDPGLASRIDELEANLNTEYGNNSSPQDLEASTNWGKQVAQAVIAYSQTDTEGETQVRDPQPHSYVPPTGEGYWTFSAEPERALFPYWEKVRTFVVSPDQTTAIPPISYSEDPNSEYYQQMLEVYQSNNDARKEDGEDLWIAEFWSDDVENLTFSPPARQVSIARQLIDQFDLNLEEALHLNLKVGFALNDAAVAAWKYKYEFMVMRPNVFIHEFIDPNFQTNLYRLIPWPNPTFPSYPSGHSCFASAAGGVFIDFLGNEVNFTDRSHEGRSEFRGAPRTFPTVEEFAAENAFSRIPLGVHMRMDCSEGLRLGYEIADAINDFRLRRRRS
ncbi:MAG: vanadium-dependent haloperoxidase [Saprospiraceae bacterium]|nr:vanadium-dependent haloperoxidase [Saprospiraceae bacterium]